QEHASVRAQPEAGQEGVAISDPCLEHDREDSAGEVIGTDEPPARESPPSNCLSSPNRSASRYRPTAPQNAPVRSPPTIITPSSMAATYRGRWLSLSSSSFSRSSRVCARSAPR